MRSRHTAARSDSPFLRTLNGTWRFHLYPCPDAVPAAVTQPDHDDGTWTTIAVPGNWQLQGHDIPYYTDNQLPFPPDDLHARARRRQPHRRLPLLLRPAARVGRPPGTAHLPRRRLSLSRLAQRRRHRL